MNIFPIFSRRRIGLKVVVRKFRTTTQHGALEGYQSQEVKYYNLYVIISVGMCKLIQKQMLPPVGLKTFEGELPAIKDIKIAKNYLDKN